MPNKKNLRTAWLFPSLAFANYWHPVLAEFSKIYPKTIIYTGSWPGFSPGFEEAFTVKVVGEMKFIDQSGSAAGYSSGFIQVSPKIIYELLKFKPDIVFTTGFCIWTLFAILLKFIFRWRVVIAYEGSSPGVDYRNSLVRLSLRWIMARLTDAFITNSQAGQGYLIQYLKANPKAVFVQPYEVPDTSALLKQTEVTELPPRFLRPIFLFTGQLVARKGLQPLLEACKQVRDQNYSYTLLVAGDGAQREELQAFCESQELESVLWLGWISYDQLGRYFRQTDVFILPTLEDTWGMVVLEAMAFGKPILCSKWAGASEMVIEGENGYLFDPYNSQEIAAAMIRLIKQPNLISVMGQHSKELIAGHTPNNAAQFLAKVANTVMEVGR